MAGLNVQVTITGTEFFNEVGHVIQKAELDMAENVLDSASAKVKKEIRSKTPSGRTGGLLDSIDIKSPDKSTRQIGPQGAFGTKGSPLPRRYGFYVDQGAGAHFPNFSDVAKRYGVDERAGFAIARAISRKGTPRTAFVTSNYAFAQKALADSMKRYIDIYLAFR
jgi:hypothetical protein